MAIKDTRRLYRQVPFALIVTFFVSAFVPLPSGTAQPADTGVSFAEGAWEAVTVSGGTFSSSGQTATSDIRGELSFTSIDGVLDGVWAVRGTGVLSGVAGNGTATYTGTGRVAGTSSDIEIIGDAFNVSFEAVTADGTISGSFDLPGGDVSPFEIVLERGTCGQVIGRWIATAEGFEGGGTLFAFRSGDLLAGDASDYATEASDLLADAFAFTDSVAAGEVVDIPGGLSDLLGRADDLNRRLRRSAECLPEEFAGAYISLVGDAVRQLLDFALDNPSQFDDIDLLQLVMAAVATDAFGGSAGDALWSEVALELANRLEAALAAGSDIEAILAAAEIIGDWDLVESVRGS